MAQGTLQTLDRGIEALLLVARTPGGIKVGELADHLALHRAVAYRIVSTLSGHGMVRRLEDGRIVLGAAAFQLGAQATDSIRAQVRPILEDLAERTGATAFLSMAEGEECVVVQTVEPRQTMVTIHYRVGIRHPLNRGAAGIAILAARPARPDDPDEVRLARAQGFSATRGQIHKGAVGVSSPVHLSGAGFAGMEYSIGVVALETLDMETACRAVPEAARTLSDRFA